MKLIVEYKGGNDFKLLEIIDGDDHYIVEGECLRCGICCEWAMVKELCKHLQYETVDGKRQAVCGLYPWWPIGCNLWPMLRDIEDIPEGCAFKLVRK